MHVEDQATFQPCAVSHTPQQLKTRNAALEAQMGKEAELRESRPVFDHHKVDNHESMDADKEGVANNGGGTEGRDSPHVRAASPYSNANGVAYVASQNMQANQSPGEQICVGKQLRLLCGTPQEFSHVS